MIRAVLGDVDIQNGSILLHEHLQINLSHNKGPDTVLGPGEEQPVGDDLHHTAQTYGLTAITDLSTLGSGRDVEALHRISAASGVAVVAATGFYWEPVPPSILDMNSDQISKVMIKEIEDGAEGGVRCGVIKIGTDNGKPDSITERIFAAAVKAAQATGVAIITHTSQPVQARWHVDFFKAAGMDMRRVLISHLHKSASTDDIIDIAKEGAFVGFDQIGFVKGPTTEQIADRTVEMIKRGIGDHLILASDVAAKSRLRVNGGKSYGTIFNTFLPLLRERGLDEATITKLMHENPLKVLSLKS